MSPQRIMVILCGTVAMLILMLLRRKRYPDIAAWKYPIISLLLTVAGVVGTLLMFYIETGRFGGTSFFGAILFVPVLILPALLLRVPYEKLMDICAPAECAMLAVMKLDCLAQGCCSGRYFPALDIRFPSQIVEMIITLCIMTALIYLAKSTKRDGKIYGFYLVLYGVCRFAVNWLRHGLTPFVWILPAGNFWSLIAIAFGFIWLFVMNSQVLKKNTSAKE